MIPGFIWNRVLSWFPHQPSNRGKSLSKCFEWTNIPPTQPAPEFKYLYEQNTAKSTFKSCNCNGTFPVAWAKSQPTVQP